MIHALISLGWCAICLVVGANSAALLVPAFWYAGREFAQAEYRYIAANCGDRRVNMPWYAGFLPAAWNRKSLLDWLLPSLVCLALYWLEYFWR